MTRLSNQPGKANDSRYDEIKGYIHLNGICNVILTAPHAQGPSSDLFTGEIAYRVGRITGAHVFISTISREKLDLNHPSKQARMSNFRSELESLVKLLIKEYNDVLLIDLHGMNKDDGPDIYLGTLSGTTAKIEVINLIIDELEDEGIEAWLAEYFEPTLIGGDITASLGKLGDNINAIQFEINQHLRQIGKKQILKALIKVIKKWNDRYKPIWGTAAILKSIGGTKFPINTKNELIRTLGGSNAIIRWARGKDLSVKEIIDHIDNSWFPFLNSKDLIRSIKLNIGS